jgi:hypothetical protein
MSLALLKPLSLSLSLSLFLEDTYILSSFSTLRRMLGSNI